MEKRKYLFAQYLLYCNAPYSALFAIELPALVLEF